MKRLACLVLFLASWVPSLSGPVLEVEQDALFVHAIGRDFLPPEMTGTARMVNDGFSGRGYDNPNVGWLRDRFPLQTHTEDGRLAVVSYLSFLDPAGQPYDGSAYIPVPRPADLPATAKSFQSDGGYKWMEVRALPLIIEGGNLLALPGRLLVGEKVLHENAMTAEEHLARAGGARDLMAPRLRGMQKNGWKPRSRDEVLAELARAFEIPASAIHVMPWMPGERTGHVDLYVGVLDDHTLAVPAIPSKLIDDLGYEHERTFATRINGWLDARAADLAAWTAGAMKVERVPMLPPKMLKPGGLSEFGFDAQFLTPVNWVMSRGLTYVPVFPQWLAGLHAGQAQEVTGALERTLAAHGRRMVAVPATRLLDYNGLLHCLTGQLEMP